MGISWPTPTTVSMRSSAVADRRQQFLADLFGIEGVDLGGHCDHGMWAYPPDLEVFGGHGYCVPDGERRTTSSAMSSRAGSLPTMAAITAAQAASGGWAVTVRHSRARPWSIG